MMDEKDQKHMSASLDNVLRRAAANPAMQHTWMTQKDAEGKTFDQRAKALAGTTDFKGMQDLLAEYADAVEDKNEAAAAKYYHQATNPGSIYTHDKHVEKVLIAMLAGMKGAAGMAMGGVIPGMPGMPSMGGAGGARGSTEKTAGLSWEKEANRRAEQVVADTMTMTRAALIAKERGEETFQFGGREERFNVEKYLTTKRDIHRPLDAARVADDKEQAYTDAIARQKELELIKMREEGYDPIQVQQQRDDKLAELRRRNALTPEERRNEDMQKSEGAVEATQFSMMGFLKKSAVAGWSQLVGGEKVDQGDPAERDQKKITLLEQAKDALITLAAAAAGGAEAEDGALGMFDTKAFGESVALFSTSATELSKALASPVKMEVTGKVEMVVQIKGSEVFEDAKDAFTQVVVSKVNTGIKNFVKHMKSAGGNLDGNLDFAEGNNQAKPAGNGGD